MRWIKSLNLWTTIVVVLATIVNVWIYHDNLKWRKEMDRDVQIIQLQKEIQAEKIVRGMLREPKKDVLPLLTEVKKDPELYHMVVTKIGEECEIDRLKHESEKKDGRHPASD